ncbi:hypothetical protein DPMN_194542 [Dreissena polymorpha]|uniref:Sushi domain-containing protein n=1 Tax=Dreissena polymorpha TaxID=45954 RepID=A0A9D3Y6C8_DREPO|nr:hypothetical protein DPMN_194542 [Dreissena polymorpha]
MRTSVVCIFIFLWRIQANNYSEPYICYGDVCNSESPAQFCDVVYRHCRRCDDIRGDCFTRHQTFNCTEYCYEIRYKEEVEKLRVAGCTILSPPNNGHLDDHRTHVPFNDTLKFTCNDGYVPTYIDLVRCGEFSMWSGPLPKCEISTNKTPTVLTIICVVCGVCFLVSLLGNIFMNAPALLPPLQKNKNLTLLFAPIQTSRNRVNIQTILSMKTEAGDSQEAIKRFHKKHIDEEIISPSLNGGSTVGNIINNITTTNVHLHVSSTPQPTSVGPSTATSHPRETDSTLTDKRPVEETDILGSQSGTPSQTVRAVPPENDGTALKNI